MAMEIVVQVGLLILTLAIFYSVRYIYEKPLSRLRNKSRTAAETNRHLAQATRLLARAKSSGERPKSQTIARAALTEAQTAVSVDPRDPQTHILKARILEFMGHHRSALKSLDLALNLTRAKSLSEKEREEVVMKRDALKVRVSKKKAVEDSTLQKGG